MTDWFRRIDGMYVKLMKRNQKITTSVERDFWACLVKNLMFSSSTGDMFSSSTWVIFLKSWTSTGYFSNSTGSFVSSSQFILFILLFSWYLVLSFSGHITPSPNKTSMLWRWLPSQALMKWTHKTSTGLLGWIRDFVVRLLESHSHVIILGVFSMQFFFVVTKYVRLVSMW